LLKKYVSKPISFVLSSIYFIDVAAIPSISYNTLGRLMLVMGVVLLAEVYSSKSKFFWFRLLKSIIVGLILSVCFFCYFPLIVPIFIFFVLAIIYAKNIRNDLFPTIVAIISFLLICVFLFFFYFYPKLNDIGINIEMIKTGNIYTLDFIEKLKRLINIAKLFFVPFVVLVLYKYCEFKLKKKSYLFFILAIFIILFFSLKDTGNASLQYVKFVTLLSFVGLIGYPLFYKQLSKDMSLIYVFIIIPLSIAGLVTGLTSANGYTNICVGISPAVIFGILIIYKKIETISKDKNCFLLIILVCLSVYIFLLFNTIYGEVSFFSLTKRVESGPYKNLYTTPKKVEFVDNLLIDLNKPDIKNKKTILCYYNFPACYLFTNLKMDFYSTWIINWWMSKEKFDKIFLLNNQRITRVGSIPDVVLRYKYNDKGYMGTTVGQESTLGYDSIGKQFLINEDNFIIQNKTEDYKILIRK
jgi:hypothetical protein